MEFPLNSDSRKQHVVYLNQRVFVRFIMFIYGDKYYIFNKFGYTAKSKFEFTRIVTTEYSLASNTYSCKKVICEFLPMISGSRVLFISSLSVRYNEMSASKYSRSP